MDETHLQGVTQTAANNMKAKERIRNFTEVDGAAQINQAEQQLKAMIETMKSQQSEALSYQRSTDTFIFNNIRDSNLNSNITLNYNKKPEDEEGEEMKEIFQITNSFYQIL